MIKLLVDLLIIIIMHELGHYFAARLVKCKVLAFSLGFGKCLFKKEWKGTIWKICLIPFGGSCQLQGEEAYSSSPTALCNQPYRNKFFIASAGVAVNILVGIIALLCTNNYDLVYFGIISIIVGLTNYLPLPALDGSLIWLFLLEKKYGKKKAWKIIHIVCKIGLRIMIILNIICIPLLFIIKY